MSMIVEPTLRRMETVGDSAGDAAKELKDAAHGSKTC
jgi:hypothetical protein